MIKFIVIALVIYGMYLLYRTHIKSIQKFFVNSPLFKSIHDILQQGTNAYPASKTSLTIEEAQDILQVGKNPTKDEINTAYYACMKKYHPDIGGSKYFAAQINAARQLLLKTIRT
jgi:hypothetical protein